MQRPSASMLCFARLSSLALLMHAGRGDAASEPVCTSSHDGDSKTEGCFGWCMEAYQADHCTYCKCRGCHFCKAGGAVAVSAATSTSMTALGQATCSSDVEGDSSSKDCQPFCNAAFSNDHCHLCKCKACGFCKCSSSFEGDGEEEQCQDWCSEAFSDDHCSRCKCKGCKFCRQGRPCQSEVPGDAAFERCDSFCQNTFAADHCKLCKCKHCGFCKAGTSGVSKGPKCTSDAPIGVWDSDTESCEAFCDKTLHDSHCKLCKCKACDMCQCHSNIPGDSTKAMCEGWCSIYQWGQHCQHCKCQSCDFCTNGVPCSSNDAEDSQVEKCEPFCDKMFSKDHCKLCKCKGCTFCNAFKDYPPEPPHLPHPPGPPPEPPHVPRPPPSPPRALRAPEPPRFLKATATSCGSISLAWTAPYDKGFPITAYEVLFKLPTGVEASSFETHDSKPSTEVTGLLPSTSYQLRVRAKSEGGWGLLSSSISASTTEPLQQPPKPTAAPTLVSSSCTSITLAAPPLRSGCSGDSWYTIQWRSRLRLPSSGGDNVGWVSWKRNAQGMGSQAVDKVDGGEHFIIDGLDAGISYEARAIAHNSIGSSAPGISTGPIALGTTPAVMNSAPNAISTSAASVYLSWKGLETICRPYQTWEIQVQARLQPSSVLHQDGSADAGTSWQTFVHGVKGNRYSAYSLRCIYGCRLRTHAENISGWPIYSNASAYVVTPREPDIPPDAVRLEVGLEPRKLMDGMIGETLKEHSTRRRVEAVPRERITYGRATFDASTTNEEQHISGSASASLGRKLVDDISNALGVTPMNRVHFVWAYGNMDTLRVVLDILPKTLNPVSALPESNLAIADVGPGSTLSTAKSSLSDSPTDLASKLSGLMSAHAAHLFARSTASALSSTLGLRRIYQNGTSVELWSSYQDETSALLFAEARGFVTVIVASVLVLGFLLNVVRQATRGRSYDVASADVSEKEGLQASSDDEDDEDEDDIVDKRRRSSLPKKKSSRALDAQHYGALTKEMINAEAVDI